MVHPERRRGILQDIYTVTTEIGPIAMLESLRSWRKRNPEDTQGRTEAVVLVAVLAELLVSMHDVTPAETDLLVEAITDVLKLAVKDTTWELPMIAVRAAAWRLLHNLNGAIPAPSVTG